MTAKRKKRAAVKRRNPAAGPRDLKRRRSADSARRTYEKNKHAIRADARKYGYTASSPSMRRALTKGARPKGKLPNPGGDDAELRGARKMFKRFTGKKSTRISTVVQKRVTPSALADCGRLVELVVKLNGYRHTLKFPESTRVRVGTPGDGGQLYLVGGDQGMNLGRFGISAPHDQENLGECVSIAYFTSKDFHNFAPSEYGHKFGEILTGDGRRAMAADYELPILGYDVLSKRLYLVGGSYRVKRAGIVK